MKIVITGSAGRVGRAIRHALAGHDLIGIDRFPASDAVQHVGDVCDRDLLARAAEGASAIIHVAALHAPHVDIASYAEFERVNIAGTRAVIDTARHAGIRDIVFTSTTALYGRHGWITEDTEPHPRTIYHRTKLAAEQLLRDSGLVVRILRMSRCFPEPANLMAMYRVHRGIDARDVAMAHARALAHPHAGTWNISGATPFVPDDAAPLAADAPPVVRMRAPALAADFAARAWELPPSIDRVYDASRATRELGWTPRYDYREVLAQLDRASGEVLLPRLSSSD